VLGQAERLPERKADGAGEGELGLGEAHLGDDRLLLAGRALHLGAQDVERGSEAGLLAVLGQLMEDPRGFELGARGVDPALLGHRPHVEVRGGEDHAVTHILEVEAGGLDAPLLRPDLLVGTEREHGVRHLGADVEDVERTHQRGDVGEADDAGEAERFQVDLLSRLREAEGELGQQLGKGFPARSLRGADPLLAEEQPEVPLQAALDGVEQGQVEHLGRRRPRRHAAIERPVVPRVRRRRWLQRRKEKEQEERRAH